MSLTLSVVITNKVVFRNFFSGFPRWILTLVRRMDRQAYRQRNRKVFHFFLLRHETLKINKTATIARLQTEAYELYNWWKDAVITFRHQRCQQYVVLRVARWQYYMLKFSGYLNIALLSSSNHYGSGTESQSFALYEPILLWGTGPTQGKTHSICNNFPF